MNNNRLDVIGIGNAMVDAFILSTKEDIEKWKAEELFLDPLL